MGEQFLVQGGEWVNSSWSRGGVGEQFMVWEGSGQEFMVVSGGPMDPPPPNNNRRSDTTENITFHRTTVIKRTCFCRVSTFLVNISKRIIRFSQVRLSFYYLV